MIDQSVYLVSYSASNFAGCAYAEAVYIQNMPELTLKQSEFYQKRITLAHNRYLSAIRTLTQVRRLGVPAVQVNIGEQQVNVA